MNQEAMRTKPILSLVLSMSLPMMISMLINSLYNIVDSFYVASLSEQAMTAVSLIYPLQTLVLAIGVGFGVGISAAIAYYMGSNDQLSADKIASQSCLLSVIHGIVLSIFCYVTTPYFVRLFTSDASVIEMATQYGRIVLSFSVVATLTMAFEKVFQAVGNMKIPFISMTIGCILNMILDPIFIFAFDMKVAGAAIATVIGMVVSLIIYFVFFAYRKLAVTPSFALMKPTGLVKRVYQVGIPSALTIGLPSLQVSLLNGIVAGLGELNLLIVGVYFKLQSFIYLPANGIVQGMRPILGFNYGANEKVRMHSIINTCGAIMLAIMGVGTAVFLLGAPTIMSWFTTSSTTLTLGSNALRIISLGFVFSAISVLVCGAMEALGKGVHSFILSLLRYLVILIPTALLLSLWIGINGVWAAFVVAEITTAIISLYFMRKVMRAIE